METEQTDKGAISTKKLVGPAIVAVILAVCGLVFYRVSYPIPSGWTTMPGYIQDFYNRGYKIPPSPSITLHGGAEIGRTNYLLVEINSEELGVATLERGFAGRYRITGLSYGDTNFLNEVVTYKNSKYLLWGGRDITGQIASATVELDGQTYDIPLPGAEYFLRWIEVSPHTKDDHTDPATTRLYNARGEEITDQYDLSSGGI